MLGLRLGDPDEPVAIGDGEARQLTGVGGEAVEDRLDEVVDAGADVVAQAQHGQLEGEPVAALALLLLDETRLLQQCEQPVHDALGQVQAVAKFRQRHAVGMTRQVLEEKQRSLRGRLVQGARSLTGTEFR